MSQITRLQPDCPPDAHKVMREPENKLNALLAVKVNLNELETFGAADAAEVLALMSSSPNLICTEEVYARICAQAEAAEIKPNLTVIAGDTAHLRYFDGAQGPELKFYDFAGAYQNAEHFLEHLSEQCIISVDMLSMLILRSISTVYPWDKLLAGDFIRQYLTASAPLTAKDKELLTDIRYGRASSDIKKTEPAAYQFLRLERKLFLQYPSED